MRLVHDALVLYCIILVFVSTFRAIFPLQDQNDLREFFDGCIGAAVLNAAMFARGRHTRKAPMRSSRRKFQIIIVSLGVEILIRMLNR